MTDEQIVDMQAECDVLTHELEVARECYVEQLVRANAFAAIVRELAERGPHIKELSIGVLCRTCPLKLPWDTWQRILTAESHEPDCIWRRAKVLYPEPGA